MKGSFPLAFVFSLGAALMAQQPWPERVADATFRSTDTTTLPNGLPEALLKWDEFSQGKSQLPASLTVARVDLNGDSVDEFIVQSAQTYSGGPMMWVFEQHDGKFVEIADAQGNIYLAPRVNGYFEIVSQSREGAGQYTRELQRYELHGHYERVRRAYYRESEPGGALQFIDEGLPVRGLAAHHRTALSASEQDAREAWIRQLRETRDPKDSPTVQEFLGGTVTHVTVTQVVAGVFDNATAQKLVDDLMNSLLVQPHSEGPFVRQAWSEGSSAYITAVIKYDNGRVGLLETDGRGHLFMEDHDGIGWWYRWDPTFPRAGRRLTS